MGWGEKLPGGMYRAVWRDELGDQRSRSGFKRKVQAERYANAQELACREGGPSYQGRSMTWAEWRDLWLPMRRVEATTLDAELPRISKWVEPRWGKVPIAKITRRDVQVWVNELSSQMAPASVAKVYRILAKSLADAVDTDALRANPCVRISLPQVAPGSERYLTREEVDRALAAIAEPYRAAIILLVGTGMRFGEMAGLHWDRIDLRNLAVDVVETWSSAAGAVKPYPKGKRLRRVPLPQWVADAVGQPSQANSCGLPHARGSACRSGLVFVGPRGKPLNDGNLRARHWLPALKHAGLSHARQHDLRHTYASWLLQDGASLSDLAEVLGHSSITVTQRYAHLAPTHAEKIRSILESGRAAHVAAVGGPELGDSVGCEA